MPLNSNNTSKPVEMPAKPTTARNQSESQFCVPDKGEGDTGCHERDTGMPTVLKGPAL
jgi:hypothetical protein